jgi:hypothetical protein
LNPEQGFFLFASFARPVTRGGAKMNKTELKEIMTNIGILVCELQTERNMTDDEDRGEFLDIAIGTGTKFFCALDNL